MRLNQVTLPVADIARAKAFYLSLGLTLLVDSPRYARFQAPEGDASFSVSQSDAHDPAAAAAHGAHVYFEFDSPDALDAWTAGLTERGVALMSGPADQSWLWREARLRDPDGHELVFFHAGENRLNPPWRVGREGR